MITLKSNIFLIIFEPIVSKWLENQSVYSKLVSKSKNGSIKSIKIDYPNVFVDQFLATKCSEYDEPRNHRISMQY